ncbi:hypothetical protein C8Q79DRAFT_1012905 [Trametes meyenii]|nr:hypothetical protein C8Q79DRAFT_1012905 [Trametes meyenii]
MPKAATKPKQAAQRPRRAKAKAVAETGGTVDSSQWRASRIPEDQTINKTRALDEYRLKLEHISDLPFTPVENYRVGGTCPEVTMCLYKERAIERRAWERHGGPEAFDAYIEKLRRAHEARNARKGTKTRFTQPYTYDPTRQLPAHVACWRTATAAGSARLSRIQQEIPRWIWDECLKVLRREDMITQILKAMYYDPDGLEKYEWPSEYLESLFCALCDLITAHGVGDAGWRSIRWEVYDKYTECVKGISYQREEREYRWIDEAIHWLDGQYSTELKWTDISFARSSRAQASAGTRYNSILPWLR